MEIFISIFILVGSLFFFIASLGLFRFKELFSRMHATTKATSFGVLLLIIGVSLIHNLPWVYFKGLLIIVFIYLTAPLAAHAIAKSSDKFKNQDDIS
jgi:multicomponent Na+:H+ antiporter subunit G